MLTARNVSHSPQLQRGRSQNLLFRLSFRAARQSLKVMEWVRGHRRLLLRSHFIPLVPPSPSSMLATAPLSLNVSFRGLRDLARPRRVAGNLPSGAGMSRATAPRSSFQQG